MRSRMIKSRFVIEVEDDGVGMAAAYMRRAFQTRSRQLRKMVWAGRESAWRMSASV